MIVVIAFVLAAATGATIRHLTRLRLAHVAPIPVGTLTVNVVGSFLLGLVVGWDPPGSTIVGTAGLGALTTFSTFSEEAVELRSGGWVRTVVYVAVSVVGGVAAAWTGLRLV